MKLALRLLSLLIATLACGGCISVANRGLGKAPEQALSEVRETQLGREVLDLSAARDGKSGYHTVHSGLDGLALRVQIIRHAQRTLDLQYFIFRGDETGTLIREELRRAAERGVRVRVLVDDGDTVAGDEKLLELDGHDNLEVRIFNPFDTRSHNPLVRNLDFLFHKSRLDYRMHNKLLVADNAVALVGGRNIGNQYFQVDPESQFADDELFVAGPMSQQLSKEFDQFWNSDISVPARALGGLPLYQPPAAIPVVPGEGPKYLDRIASDQPYEGFINDQGSLIWTGAKLIYDSPDKKQVEDHQQGGRLMSRAVEAQIEHASREVLILSPYFVPSDHELTLLQDASGRGAKVEVLTNSLEAAPSLAAQSGYSKYRLPLLSAGVELFEVRALLDSTQGSGQTKRVSRYGNYALHAKLYIFDRQRSFVGSWNYDQRSLRINTEMGLLIDDSVLSRDIARRFDEMTQPAAAYRLLLDSRPGDAPRLVWQTEFDHKPLRLFKEPSRGLWQVSRERLLALLPLGPEL